MPAQEGKVASEGGSPPPPKGRKWKVAIVGGGCAGMAAAWQLSKLGRQYEVHVYEGSPILGGKGASVRESGSGRILEHGLHVWLGFYDNAFAMMRECYAEVQQDRTSNAEQKLGPLPHGRFEEAFLPEPQIGVAGLDSAGKTRFWTGQLPPMPGLPGDPIAEGNNPFTLASYMVRCLHLLKTLVLSVIGPAGEGASSVSRPDDRARFDEAVERNFNFDPARSPSVLVEQMAKLARAGGLTAAALLLQAATMAEERLRELDFESRNLGTLRELLEALATQTRRLLRDVVAVDEDMRWKTAIIDIVITIVVGLWRDRVLFSRRGLDSINHIDYRAWLTKHGATKAATESPFMTGIYDLVFAYRDGDRQRPALAAGVALRGALRMFFTYRGAMFWRMRSGMGETVFSPLFRVLHRRGVQFHLQHRLTGVGWSKAPAGKRRIDTLDFAAAATQPFADPARVLDAFGCWPQAAPVPGEGERPLGDLKLRRGEHFDAVILALGIGDLELVSGEAPAGGKAKFVDQVEWQRMVKATKTVGTRSLQVWFDKDLDALGWHRGPAVVSALEPPYETWADMTHTLQSEARWRAAHAKADPQAPPARSVAYFCGVLPEPKTSGIAAAAPPPEDPATLEQMARLWPDGDESGRLVRSILGPHHAQVNDQGSARYTLSLPGTLRERISPLAPLFENATVAGDWTASGLDAGCVEAAVMSGMLAAHAISGGTPNLDDIIGFNHP